VQAQATSGVMPGARVANRGARNFPQDCRTDLPVACANEEASFHRGRGGRGEPLLADWGRGLTPLVADEHIVQIGERNDRDPDYSYADIRQTRMRRLIVQTALAQEIEVTAREAARFLDAAHLERTWLHVDVDVLDEKVMPVVDSPGSPGLDFDQLATLIQGLRASGHIIGADVSVFDPELDPDGRYATGLAQTLATAFRRS